MKLVSFAACAPIAGLVSLALTAACTSFPAGYVAASEQERSEFFQRTRTLASGCTDAPQGTFLAEVRAGKPAIGFQMEGTWRGTDAFEAQFLSPLGEAWAQFGFGAKGAQVSYGAPVSDAQKPQLQTFVDTLATLGPTLLRAVACGSGLLDLRDARIAVARGSAALAEGRITVASHDVNVSSRVEETPAGVLTITSTVSAGFWRSQGGVLRWSGVRRTDEGAPVTSGGRVHPRSLAIERTGEEPVVLTFLEFD